MAKAKLTNEVILNSIHQNASAEYQDKMPIATSENGEQMFNILREYPTLKNEFINTLTNRIGKQMFFSKVFTNPYTMLKKGLLPYGKTIEELFVEMAEKKGWNDNFTGSTSQEGDLIKAITPSVKVDYVSENYQYKFKTSISDIQLKGAFTSQDGLSSLLTQIISSLSSSVNYEEYKDIKKLLIGSTIESANGSKIGKGIAHLIAEDTVAKNNCLIPVTGTGKELVKSIRTYANKLTFPSKKYNLQGVNQWSNKEDLVLFVTPEVQAEIDVEVLASAFNVSSADVNVRMIIVDELGTVTVGTEQKAITAILADKDLIQAYDTVNETNTFYNADRLTTNYFAHKWGIMALCKFANAIVFHA